MPAVFQPGLHHPDLRLHIRLAGFQSGYVLLQKFLVKVKAERINLPEHLPFRDLLPFTHREGDKFS